MRYRTSMIRLWSQTGRSKKKNIVIVLKKEDNLVVSSFFYVGDKCLKSFAGFSIYDFYVAI